MAIIFSMNSLQMNIILNQTFRTKSRSEIFFRLAVLTNSFIEHLFAIALFIFLKKKNRSYTFEDKFNTLETYSEPSQTFKTKIFTKMVDVFQLLANIAKNSILD